jgi:malate permease and related proteins
MILLNAVQSILSILLMISIGYILAFKGWFKEEDSKLFSKIVINLSLPALMVSNMLENFSKENLTHAGKGILIPFFSIIVCYLISIILTKLLKIKPERKGTFQCMFFLSNTIFIGLPVNLALFGDQSIPYVLYYYFSNTTIFWTIGVNIINKDGGGKNEILFNKELLKRIFTPPLVGFIFSLILIFLNIHLPKFIIDSCKYLGNLTTPLSMLFIGIVISSISLKSFKFDKYMLWIIIGRFLVSPLVTYGFALIFSAPLIMKNVFIIQAALPVMANTAIVTKEYGADYEYAAVMIAITTILSLVFIPIYRVII